MGVKDLDFGDITMAQCYSDMLGFIATVQLLGEDRLAWLVGRLAEQMLANPLDEWDRARNDLIRAAINYIKTFGYVSKSCK